VLDRDTVLDDISIYWFTRTGAWCTASGAGGRHRLACGGALTGASMGDAALSDPDALG
jgi:hypothetical protein